MKLLFLLGYECVTRQRRDVCRSKYSSVSSSIRLLFFFSFFKTDFFDENELDATLYHRHRRPSNQRSTTNDIDIVVDEDDNIERSGLIQ